VEKVPEFGTLDWVKHTDKWHAAQKRVAAAGGF
jgi:hypothetical protein